MFAAGAADLPNLTRTLDTKKRTNCALFFLPKTY